MTTTAHDGASEVLAERQAVLDRIAGDTLLALLDRVVDARTDSPAYSDRHGTEADRGEDGWRTLSWTQTRALADAVASGLVSRGMQAGDRVAIMGSNRIEHMVGDMAVLRAGGVPMSIYSTLSVDQVAYVASQSTPSVAILETTDHLERWSQALTEAGVHTVVLMDPEAVPSEEGRYLTWDQLAGLGERHLDENRDELAARAAAVRPEDAGTILYTSGTTGNPKGVELTHQNILFNARSTIEAAQLHDPQIQVSYLPLAHIAERILSLYGAQVHGGHAYCIADPSELLATLGQVRPTAFFGVPRVWEKIKTGVSAKLAADPDPANQKLVTDAMAAGLAWVKAHETGNTMTPEIQAAWEQADGAILGFLRQILGMDRVTWSASAAAPMPLDVATFMAGLGLKVFDVYGMTETTGAFTANGPGRFRLGSVGRAILGTEVRIAEDGEVLTRGPVNTPGYYLNPEATAGLIDEDGWLHTGDIGAIDADGFVTIVDRKKELIITSQGKNVAPSNIENLLKESPLIGHAMAIGDAKPYVVAVLTLDGEIAPLAAGQMGVEFTDLADLSSKPQIRAAVQAAVDAANARLSRPEQVKKWTLLATEWTAESAELTPTLKLKRRVVNTNYAAEIAAMYEGSDA